MSIPGHDTNQVQIRQRVRIPLRSIAEPVEFVTFKGLPPGDEPIALVFGTLRRDRPTLLRLHSECLTGDVFHSLKCDCGAQLHEAMDVLSANDGVLLYLRQEGRGIGLYAKLDAYQLQAQGLDTFAANRALGFGEDLRAYGDSAAMLRALGIAEVELISNNPDKARQLKAHGIRVTRVHSTAVHVNVHNRPYLDAKKQQHFHTLDLCDPVPEPAVLPPYQTSEESS
jgi:GTP cyclohydrolase II